MLLGGLLTLRLIRNPGAAFSLGENFTMVFAIAAVGVLTFVVLRWCPGSTTRAGRSPSVCWCAGVSGNLMDRMFRAPGVLRGHVVDFFQFPKLPIFNVADMCITSAAVLIMILAVIKNVGIRESGQAVTE